MKQCLSSLICLCFLVTGCTSTRQISPQFNQQIENVQTIAVMPPQIKMYQFQAGGTTEEIDEWNTLVTDVVVSSIDEGLKAQNFDVKFVEEGYLYNIFPGLWADTEVLYEAVAASAFTHTLTKDKFPAKATHFDYTLGSDIAPMAEGLNADSLLFVYGYDYVTTGGRRALQTFNAVAAVALSVAVGGIAVAVVPEQSPTFLSMGLVDGKTGELLWFKIIPPDRGQNFLNTKTLHKTIAWMIKDLQVESVAP